MTIQEPIQITSQVPIVDDAAARAMQAPTIASALAAAGADQWLNVSERALLAEFWRRAGVQLAYPRALDRALSIALPVATVRIPQLRPRNADAWLLARGKAPRFDSHTEARADRKSAVPDRQLHGCYVGSRGYGLIFIDGADGDDEARFTLAHEAAHFLLDYLHPREQAIARFGEEIVPVLNGDRLPTLRERFRSIRAQLPIGSRIDFMQRNLGGSDALELVEVEDRADRFAFALLAPPREVLGAVIEAPYADQLAHLHALLTNKYGLPAQPALQYARGLLACIGSTPAPWQDLRAHGARKKATGTS